MRSVTKLLQESQGQVSSMSKKKSTRKCETECLEKKSLNTCSKVCLSIKRITVYDKNEKKELGTERQRQRKKEREVEKEPYLFADNWQNHSGREQLYWQLDSLWVTGTDSCWIILLHSFPASTERRVDGSQQLLSASVPASSHHVLQAEAWWGSNSLGVMASQTASKATAWGWGEETTSVTTWWWQLAQIKLHLSRCTGD